MGPIVVMKALMMGKELGDLSTIEEEASVDEIRGAVEKMNSGSTQENKGDKDN